MKNLLVILFSISMISCSAQHKFYWLVGTWKLKSKNVYEVWKYSADKKDLIGTSFRVNGTDTVVMEKIKLTFADGSYHYIPDVPQNKKPVDFKVTKFDDASFVSENPEHDFPKLIRYRYYRDGELELIEAAIEGNGKTIPYSFQKLQ